MRKLVVMEQRSGKEMLLRYLYIYPVKGRNDVFFERNRQHDWTYVALIKDRLWSQAFRFARYVRRKRSLYRFDPAAKHKPDAPFVS